MDLQANRCSFLARIVLAVSSPGVLPVGAQAQSQQPAHITAEKAGVVPAAAAPNKRPQWDTRITISDRVKSKVRDALAQMLPAQSSNFIIVDCGGDYDHTTIQGAIDAAEDGDTIWVLPNDCTFYNRYYENIDFLGKAITVRSALPEDPEIVDATAIDGFQETVVRFANQESSDSQLLGLTITGGYPGVWCGSSPTIRYCRIVNNHRGMFVAGTDESPARPAISHCRICSNGFYGDAAASAGQASRNVSRVTVLGSGGLALDDQAAPLISDCLFAHNEGSTSGAVQVFNLAAGSEVRLQHCTMVHNSGSYAGSLHALGGDGSVVFDHCILWNHNDGYYGDFEIDLGDEFSGIVTLNYCDLLGGPDAVGGNAEAVVWGPGSFDQDPLLPLVSQNDYHLTPASPCINAGDPAFDPEPGATDLDGVPRVQLGRVDVGAYEAPAFRDCNDNGMPDWQDIADGTSVDQDRNGYPDECPTIFLYVDDDAPDDPGPRDPAISDPAEDGSANHPFDSVQEGIIHTTTGEVVRLAEGSYNEAVNFLNRRITVTSGDPFDPSVVQNTIIDGSSYDTSTVTFDHVEGPASILEGVTVTGGSGTSMYLVNYQDPIHWGGGVLIIDANPTVRHCRLVNNQATRGGGMAIYNGAPTITDTTIEANEVGLEPGTGSLWLPFGAGVDVLDASATFRRCEISNNLVDVFYDDEEYLGRGGGISFHTFESSDVLQLKIDACRLSNNVVNGHYDNPFFLSAGGAIDSADYQGSVAAQLHLYIKNSMITGNQGFTGAGMFLGASTLAVLDGVTIAGNFYDQDSGNGIETQGAMTVIRNSIVYGNMPVDIQNGEGNNGYVFEHSNIAQVDGVEIDGPGLISIDPLFIDPEGGNYHLAPDSPCIDAGDPAFEPVEGETDIDGDPRVLDGDEDEVPVIDMGADEFTGCVGDFDADGSVDIVDLLFVLAEWGQFESPADLDGDGTVDVADLQVLLAAWGECA